MDSRNRSSVIGRKSSTIWSFTELARPQNDLRAVITCKTNLGKGDSLKHTANNHLQFIIEQIFIRIESIKDANRKNTLIN